jgi:hypothetical protein
MLSYLIIEMLNITVMCYFLFQIFIWSSLDIEPNCSIQEKQGSSSYAQVLKIYSGDTCLTILTSASLVIRNPNCANKIVVIYRVVLLIILWSLLVQRYYFNLQSHCSVCRLRSVLPYKQQR